MKYSYFIHYIIGAFQTRCTVSRQNKIESIDDIAAIELEIKNDIWMDSMTDPRVLSYILMKEDKDQ